MDLLNLQTVIFRKSPNPPQEILHIVHRVSCLVFAFVDPIYSQIHGSKAPLEVIQDCLLLANNCAEGLHYPLQLPYVLILALSGLFSAPLGASALVGLLEPLPYIFPPLTDFHVKLVNLSHQFFPGMTGGQRPALHLFTLLLGFRRTLPQVKHCLWLSLGLWARGLFQSELDPLGALIQYFSFILAFDPASYLI